MLLLAGVVGVIGGLVPFTINALRILVSSDLWGSVDFAAHGVEAMGLSVEWGLLSSAIGTFLGVLMVAAGRGFITSRAWARPVAWSYVFGGITVNVTDMVIFAFVAKEGAMRTQMLILDGGALLFPAAVAIALTAFKPRN